MTTHRKKGGLRILFVLALALGASSATLSGTLAALASQHAETAVA